MFFQTTQWYWLMDDWSPYWCNLSTFAVLQEDTTICKVVHDPSHPKGNGKQQENMF